MIFNPVFISENSSFDFTSSNNNLGWGSYDYSTSSQVLTNLSRVVNSSITTYTIAPYNNLGADQYFCLSSCSSAPNSPRYISVIKLDKNNQLSVLYQSASNNNYSRRNGTNDAGTTFFRNYRLDSNNQILVTISTNINVDIRLEYYVDLSSLTAHEGTYSMNTSLGSTTLDYNDSFRINMILSEELQGISPKVVKLSYNNTGRIRAVIGGGTTQTKTVRGFSGDTNRIVLLDRNTYSGSLELNSWCVTSNSSQENDSLLGIRETLYINTDGSSYLEYTNRINDYIIRLSSLTASNIYANVTYYT